MAALLWRQPAQSRLAIGFPFRLRPWLWLPQNMDHLEVWISVGVLLVSVLTVIVLLSPRVAHSVRWRATVTPLASIIGSGFLVLGPILVREYGRAAPIVMLGLCVAAYAFGSAIRYNIRHYESDASDQPRVVRVVESISSYALTIAYVISVSYYLNLLGSFAVSLTPVDDRFAASLVTTAVVLFIGLYGVLHGLEKLERLEETAVTIKLAIIAGLLLGMSVFAIRLFTQKSLAANPIPTPDLNSLFLAFGLVICVQGFETSRYLGEEYDAETRILTMKIAQWVSACVYLIYTALMAFSFDADSVGSSETAIIDVTRMVAPILPAMLVAAALAAQFSAAVADTAGCGGLVAELTKGRVSSRLGYVLVAAGALILTWTSDVYEIISYASRSFAVYYSLQAAVATSLAFKQRSGLAVLFAALAVSGTLIAIFGIPAE